MILVSAQMLTARIIGTRNAAGGKRFSPAHISLGGSPGSRSKSPDGSPLRLSVVRDVHTVISGLKEETAKKAMSKDQQR